MSIWVTAISLRRSGGLPVGSDVSIKDSDQSFVPAVNRSSGSQALQPSLEFAAATAYATHRFDLPSETFNSHILKSRAMLAMDESASSSPQHVPIHFLQGSTKLLITSVADHSIYIDAIDDPHRLLPANTHSSDH
jgi:hypothetical protein